MTKGLDTALYLLLCRLLHREYETAFNLTDSIATDTKFSKEGANTLKALGLANDDWHPNAHAIRLKIALMTIDSGVVPPWDLTIQAARMTVKLDRVSANCRLTEEEELQLLEAPSIVTSEQSLSYNASVHDSYSTTLVSNRRAALRAILGVGQQGDGEGVPIQVSCTVPVRSETKPWPYYTDNAALGICTGYQPLI